MDHSLSRGERGALPIIHKDNVCATQRICAAEIIRPPENREVAVMNPWMWGGA